MGDAAHRHARDRHERRQPAADVAESTEALKARHPRGQNISGVQRAAIVRTTPLLCVAAGQNGAQRPVRRVLKARDRERDRLADAGNEGDVPRRALGDADSPLVVRDDAVHTRQRHIQIVCRIAKAHRRFQHAPVERGGGKRLIACDARGVFRCFKPSALRQKCDVFHFLASFLLVSMACICADRRKDTQKGILHFGKSMVLYMYLYTMGGTP